MTSFRCSPSPSVRIAQLLAATSFFVIGGAVALSTSSCWVQCTAGCDSEAHIIVRNTANALNVDPDALFEVCGSTCSTFRVRATGCELVGSDGVSLCAVVTEGLELRVRIDDVEKESISIKVTATDGKVIFEDEAEVTTSEFTVCGQTCREGDLEFSIPQ